MTDSPDSLESPESPEIEEVRRLLADSRHSEPMPDDVVARMDDAIAGLRETPLTSEPTPAEAPRYDNVMPLVHRRRRAAGMLVAAAAIVVGGVVLAQNLPQPSSSSSVSGGASTAQDSGQSSLNAQKSPGAEDFGDNSARGATLPVIKRGRLVVHPQHFSVDALAGRRLLERAAYHPLTTQEFTHCPSVPTGDGEVLRATYQRAPAALVYRTATGGSQVVDLYLCDSGHPVRSATLPAP